MVNIHAVLILLNGIVEFSLLTSISYIKRWDLPMTCKNNESIKDIACNDVTLVHLDIKHPLYKLPIRSCSFKNNEWLVINANTSDIFHLGKDGKVKGTLSYDRPPYKALLFNANILVIRTEDGIKLS